MRELSKEDFDFDFDFDFEIDFFFLFIGLGWLAPPFYSCGLRTSPYTAQSTAQRELEIVYY
jgi:hypothetical protein